VSGAQIQIFRPSLPFAERISQPMYFICEPNFLHLDPLLQQQTTAGKRTLSSSSRILNTFGKFSTLNGLVCPSRSISDSRSDVNFLTGSRTTRRTHEYRHRSRNNLEYRFVNSTQGLGYYSRKYQQEENQGEKSPR
jgi:hypothetical protein